MAGLPAVGAEVVLSSATTLVLAEGTAVATAAIDLHGGGVLAGGCVLGWGRRLAAGVGVLQSLLLLLLLLMVLLLLLLLLVVGRVARLPGVVVGLLRDTGAHVSLETDRHPSLPSHLKPDAGFELPGEHVDSSRINPGRVELAYDGVEVDSTVPV